MGRQPSRASGIKALQAIKETTHGRAKIAAVKVNCVFLKHWILILNFFIGRVLYRYSASYTHIFGPIQKQEPLNSENPHSQSISLKRSSSPGSIVLPLAKRNALGDVTNFVQVCLHLQVYQTVILVFKRSLNHLFSHNCKLCHIPFFSWALYLASLL